MSADSVGHCPNCGLRTMREWKEFFTDIEYLGRHGEQPSTITIDYRCKCLACSFKDGFSHTYTYTGEIEA